MITKQTFSAAAPWTVFRGEAADPGPIFWELFDVNDSDFEEDPDRDLEALGISFTQAELDNEYTSLQPPGADDHDAALAYLRRGGALCKVPDAPGSTFWRLLVVGEPVSTHDFLIEARTKNGALIVSHHPYPSRVDAEHDLPRVKKLAPRRGAVWQILPIHKTCIKCGAPISDPQLVGDERCSSCAHPGSDPLPAGNAALARARRLAQAEDDAAVASALARGARALVPPRASDDWSPGAERAATEAEWAAEDAEQRLRATTQGGPSPKEHAAPAHARARVGPGWKAAVQRAWASGHYGEVAADADVAGILHRLGHGSYFGPNGLAAYKEPPPDPLGATREPAPPRGARASSERPALSPEEHAALAAVQKAVGHRWKAALRAAWASGDYREITTNQDLVGTLQGLRNASYFGPKGLVAFRKADERAPANEALHYVALWIETGEERHAETAYAKLRALDPAPQGFPKLLRFVKRRDLYGARDHLGKLVDRMDRLGGAT